MYAHIHIKLFELISVNIPRCKPKLDSCYYR